MAAAAAAAAAASSGGKQRERTVQEDEVDPGNRPSPAPGGGWGGGVLSCIVPIASALAVQATAVLGEGFYQTGRVVFVALLFLQTPPHGSQATTSRYSTVAPRGDPEAGVIGATLVQCIIFGGSRSADRNQPGIGVPRVLVGWLVGKNAQLHVLPCSSSGEFFQQARLHLDNSSKLPLCRACYK